MIEGLRRVVGKSDELHDWRLDQPIEDEPMEDAEQETEPVEESPSTESTLQPSGHDSDYYVSLIRASLSMKGKLGGHSIPIHWLRMTLAGLEGRRVAVQTMWNRTKSETQLQEDESSGRPEHSGYDDIFQPR